MSESIDIENCGEDVYILRAKGHHDLHEFMRQVRAEGYSWPLGMPEHRYQRTVPTRKDGYNCIYAFANKGDRGAYPVTYVTEGYGADSYEALIAAPQPQEQSK